MALATFIFWKVIFSLILLVIGESVHDGPTSGKGESQVNVRLYSGNHPHSKSGYRKSNGGAGGGSDHNGCDGCDGCCNPCKFPVEWPDFLKGCCCFNSRESHHGDNSNEGGDDCDDDKGKGAKRPIPVKVVLKDDAELGKQVDIEQLDEIIDSNESEYYYLPQYFTSLKQRGKKRQRRKQQRRRHKRQEPVTDLPDLPNSQKVEDGVEDLEYSDPSKKTDSEKDDRRRDKRQIQTDTTTAFPEPPTSTQAGQASQPAATELVDKRKKREPSSSTSPPLVHYSSTSAPLVQSSTNPPALPTVSRTKLSSSTTAKPISKTKATHKRSRREIPTSTPSSITVSEPPVDPISQDLKFLKDLEASTTTPQILNITENPVDKPAVPNRSKRSIPSDLTLTTESNVLSTDDTIPTIPPKQLNFYRKNRQDKPLAPIPIPPTRKPWPKSSPVNPDKIPSTEPPIIIPTAPPKEIEKLTEPPTKSPPPKKPSPPPPPPPKDKPISPGGGGRVNTDCFTFHFPQMPVIDPWLPDPNPYPPNPQPMPPCPNPCGPCGPCVDCHGNSDGGKRSGLGSDMSEEEIAPENDCINQKKRMSRDVKHQEGSAHISLSHDYTKGSPSGSSRGIELVANTKQNTPRTRRAALETQQEVTPMVDIKLATDFTNAEKQQVSNKNLEISMKTNQSDPPRSKRQAPNPVVDVGIKTDYRREKDVPPKGKGMDISAKFKYFGPTRWKRTIQQHQKPNDNVEINLHIDNESNADNTKVYVDDVLLPLRKKRNINEPEVTTSPNMEATVTLQPSTSSTTPGRNTTVSPIPIKRDAHTSTETPTTNIQAATSDPLPSRLLISPKHTNDSNLKTIHLSDEKPSNESIPQNIPPEMPQVDTSKPLRLRKRRQSNDALLEVISLTQKQESPDEKTTAPPSSTTVDPSKPLRLRKIRQTDETVVKVEGLLDKNSSTSIPTSNLPTQASSEQPSTLPVDSLTSTVPPKILSSRKKRQLPNLKVNMFEQKLPSIHGNLNTEQPSETIPPTDPAKMVLFRKKREAAELPLSLEPQTNGTELDNITIMSVVPIHITPDEPKQFYSLHQDDSTRKKGKQQEPSTLPEKEGLTNPFYPFLKRMEAAENEPKFYSTFFEFIDKLLSRDGVIKGPTGPAGPKDYFEPITNTYLDALNTLQYNYDENSANKLSDFLEKYTKHIIEAALHTTMLSEHSTLDKVAQKCIQTKNCLTIDSDDIQNKIYLTFENIASLFEDILKETKSMWNCKASTCIHQNMNHIRHLVVNTATTINNMFKNLEEIVPNLDCKAKCVKLLGTEIQKIISFFNQQITLFPHKKFIL